MICAFLLLFFFSSRRRHTRLVSDWSSDVCSSDLRRFVPVLGGADPGQDCAVRQEILLIESQSAIGGLDDAQLVLRSEERRVGKEGGARGGRSRGNIKESRTRG